MDFIYIHYEYSRLLIELISTGANHFQRVLSHEDDQALLKAYISEWRKFFAQCDYLPTPFRQLENAVRVTPMPGKKLIKESDSTVRKVLRID